MATQSIFASVMDAIYAKWVADTTLAAMVTANTLRIYDGPPAEDRSCDRELRLGAIGEDFEDPIVIAQEWATSGGPAVAERDETIDIPCSVWVWYGNNDMSATRAAAQAVFDPACTALRGQTLSLPSVMWIETSAGVFVQVATDSGAAVILTFTVRVQNRLLNI
jgi:hypothetical protein